MMPALAVADIGGVGRTSEYAECVDGRVDAIFVAPERGAPVSPVERVRAVARSGLEGDRKFFRDCSAPPGRALTLIQQEALEAMAAETGIELAPGASRRQVHTRGIDLKALVGKRFRVGEVECRGVELAEPCAHLESLTQPGVIKGLLHRGGLNADVLSDGEIAVGDAVSAHPDGSV
jgi:MOSC domain-containing protein YiiM